MGDGSYLFVASALGDELFAFAAIGKHFLSRL